MTRDEFRARFDPCFVSGAPATDVHEIARGASRKAALTEPAAWIASCRHCHANLLDCMTIARQLAHKMIRDPENYDRVAVNVLRHRAPDAVSERDVAVEVSKIFRR